MDAKYTLDNIKISAHAQERYAERIMDRNEKSDVVVFIAQHKQKIKEDIFKMIEYGTLLYSGKPVTDFNRQPVDIFLNGTWVVIVDIAKCNVITLYSIDLGLGNDFNQEYISKLMQKLNVAKEDGFETINDEGYAGHISYGKNEKDLVVYLKSGKAQLIEKELEYLLGRKAYLEGEL